MEYVGTVSLKKWVNLNGVGRKLKESDARKLFV
jgi:hypothetical protein